MKINDYMKRMNYFIKIALAILLILSIGSCKKAEEEKGIEDQDGTTETPEESSEVIPDQQNTEYFGIEALDEGNIIFYSSEGYYQYGPSIMRYEDGSMDAWFSSPGNSGSQWDWISYRHSDDGIEWSDEEIVLRPTPGSKDQCSVCDPGVVFFGGYYYLGYTATDYYAGNGSYNSAFVARSQYPDGPFEKWNGNSWGGDPEPIIKYEGDPDGFGIGEISFVVLNEDLYIYYTYYDLSGGNIELAKADLTEDWPSTIRYKESVLLRENQDSLDVVYDERLNKFFGFSIDLRMTEQSRLIMYESQNGKEFTKVDSTKTNIKDFAHNVGVSKSPEGHIDSNDELLVGYAYGEKWGRWNTVMQRVAIIR